MQNFDATHLNSGPQPAGSRTLPPVFKKIEARANARASNQVFPGLVLCGMQDTEGAARVGPDQHERISILR